MGWALPLPLLRSAVVWEKWVAGVHMLVFASPTHIAGSTDRILSNTCWIMGIMATRLEVPGKQAGWFRGLWLEILGENKKKWAKTKPVKMIRSWGEWQVWLRKEIWQSCPPALWVCSLALVLCSSTTRCVPIHSLHFSENDNDYESRNSLHLLVLVPKHLLIIFEQPWI